MSQGTQSELYVYASCVQTHKLQYVCNASHAVVHVKLPCILLPLYAHSCFFIRVLAKVKTASSTRCVQQLIGRDRGRDNCNPDRVYEDVRGSAPGSLFLVSAIFDSSGLLLEANGTKQTLVIESLHAVPSQLTLCMETLR
jgi:hypothetical protein